MYCMYSQRINHSYRITHYQCLPPLRYLCNPDDRDSNIQPAPCPEGHFCVAGTALAKPCSKGTFNPNFNGVSSNDCQPCRGGQYCESDGLKQPSGNCTAGKFEIFVTRLIFLKRLFYMSGLLPSFAG